MATDPDPQAPNVAEAPNVPTVPPLATMVIAPAAIAGIANLGLLLSGGSSPMASVVGATLMALVMGGWMNYRRNKKLAERAEILATIARFGRPAAPSGGWANPNRKQRAEAWFHRNRVFRRR